MNFLNWIFESLSDETKGSMSLVRFTYLIAFIVALKMWSSDKEIPQNFFYFLLMLVSYIFFKYRCLGIIQSVINIIANKPIKKE